MDEKRVKDYVFGKLYGNSLLEKHISKSSIVLTIKEDGIWDIMVFFPDDIFFQYIVSVAGDCFVIDDHKHNPWVFTRIKDYKWLKRDFSRRISIALWIFGNALVIQDKENKFSDILVEQRKKFYNLVPKLLALKYTELRSERHNLRYVLTRKRLLASKIIRATIIKLSLEICFLSENKPYPYKMFLPERSLLDTVNGNEVLRIGEKFLNAENDKLIIELSEDLIRKIVDILKGTRIFSDSRLNDWWLYLT